MDYQTPLAKARGLGSAKSGTAHWWLQRVSAAALIPLTFWLLSFMDLCLNAPYRAAHDWLASPVNAVGLLAFTLAACYHGALGLQVVIEDYIGAAGLKIVAVWAVHLTFFLLALTAVVAVLRVLTD